MARTSKKLSALEVSRINEPGKYPLGESLYLQVSKEKTKSWIFRYSFNGKDKWMGLGSFKILSMAEARSKISDYQKDVLQGIDPLTKRESNKEKLILEQGSKITFDECAMAYIDANKPGWRNKKHAQQWENTIKSYASPTIGKLSIQNINTQLVLKVLEPIWYEKTETATRLQGRIERILSWATVRGHRSGENPALWKGHLDQILPKKGSIQSVNHYKALPYNQVADFLKTLRTQDGNSYLALEFTILTLTRTSEALNSTWDEFNFEENYWLIPAERMKIKKEHKIPISPRVREILLQMKEIAVSKYVFPGGKIGRPLSNMALLTAIHRMGYKVTTHGFRSSFSDWAAECTSFPREVVEMALAHTIKNKVEAAYRRGDLFMKRILLMNTWESFCLSEPIDNKIIPLLQQNARF